MANQAVNLAALICQRRKNNESDASSQALIDVQHKIPQKRIPLLVTSLGSDAGRERLSQNGAKNLIFPGLWDKK